MVDIAAVPYGLEDSIGKAERHDVLDGFFAEVMVDAIDLLLIHFFEQLLVERLGRLEIVPERLLDDDPPPMIVALFHQSGSRKPLHDRTKKAGCGGEVIEKILMGRVLLIHLEEKILELGIQLIVAEIPGEVVKAA